MRDMSKINIGDFLSLLLPLSCRLSLPKRQYYSRTISQLFFRKGPNSWVFIFLNSSPWTIHLQLLVCPAAWSSSLLSTKNKWYEGGKVNRDICSCPFLTNTVSYSVTGTVWILTMSQSQREKVWEVALVWSMEEGSCDSNIAHWSAGMISLFPS